MGGLYTSTRVCTYSKYSHVVVNLPLFSSINVFVWLSVFIVTVSAGTGSSLTTQDGVASAGQSWAGGRLDWVGCGWYFVVTLRRDGALFVHSD